MAAFSIELAGLNVHIETLYDSTQALCSAYLCDETDSPDVCVHTSQADIDYEREQDATGSFDDAYYETLAVYRAIAEELPRFGRVLMHGSAIAIDGAAYLFMAASGTGKATHTRWWREVFARESPFMVNDDKPIVRICDEGAFVYGTPWDGKEHLSTNTCVRLCGIGLLERSDEDVAERLAAGEGIAQIMSHAYRPVAREAMLETMGVLQRISQAVPLYRVGVTNSAHAALVTRAAMAI